MAPVRQEAWTHTSRRSERCHSLIMHGQTSPEEQEVARQRGAARVLHCAAEMRRAVQASPARSEFLPPVSTNRRGSDDSLSVRVPNQRSDARLA